MAKYLFSFLFLLTIHSQAQCPFVDLSVSDFEENSSFQILQEGAEPFPADLFKTFKKELGAFSTKECLATGIAKKVVVHNPSGEIFTAFYTHDDECDGGNSYGVIVQGQDPKALAAVAVIQDSFISCLVR